MSNRWRVGLIGAGSVTQHHPKGWARLDTGAPFEMAPADHLETLRLVEDCYRLAGRETAR